MLLYVADRTLNAHTAYSTQHTVSYRDAGHPVGNMEHRAPLYKAQLLLPAFAKEMLNM